MTRRYRAQLTVSGLRSRLVQEVGSPGARDSAVTLAGRVGQLALGFAASVAIARALGPTGYGLIALLSAAVAVADALGDLGLTYAAVRAISRCLGPEPDRARWLVHGYLSLALIGNTAAAVAGILLAAPIAQLALGRPDAAPLLQLALIGLISVAGNGFVAALLQSMRCFGKLAGLQLVTTGTYLLGIAILAAADSLSVTSVVLLGVLNPLVGVAVGLRLLPRGFVSLRAAFAPPARRAWGELASFGKWLWVSALLSLLSVQLDLLLIGHWVPPAMVGVYALGYNLAMKMSVVTQTRITVLLPSVSALHTRGEMIAFARSSLVRSLLLGVGFALAVPFFEPFVGAVYGPAYAGAVGVLVVLTAVVVFDLVTTPLTLLAFPLSQPRALAAADALRVLALLVAAWLLIPTFGPIGAALARLAAQVIGTAFLLALIAVRLRALGPERASSRPIGRL